MRKIIVFLFGAALLGGGLYLLYLEAYQARVIYGKFVLAGGFLIFLGAAILWEDFVSPLLIRRKGSGP